MTDTLHSVARRMAAAGRLPGIEWDDLAKRLYPLQSKSRLNPTAAAELAWAAIQHARSKGWSVKFIPRQSACSREYVDVGGSWVFGHDVLSVLLAVERACDAAEGG